MNKYTDEFDAFDKITTDINEFFVGDEIDKEKLERLNRMRDICQEICEKERGVSAPLFPFSNRNRNGMVKLEMKNPFWTFSPAVTKRIAALFSLADDAAVAIPEGTDIIRFTFGIHDMWTEFHYDEP